MQEPSSPQLLVPRYRRGCLVACAASFLMIPLSATALVLTDGEQELTELAVGDDLRIEGEGEQDLAGYQVVLLDEQGVEVAEVRLKGPRTGGGSILLWRRSGVVGCDPSAVHDPLTYRYRDFLLAEASLVGRLFSVELRDPHGVAERSADVLWVAPTSPRFFFSDHTGCPRSELGLAEDLYLSALRADPGDLLTTIFLVEQGNEVSEDGKILEVRRARRLKPQSLSAPVATGQWSARLWAWGDTEPGSYGVILRWHDGPTGFELKPEDLGIGVLGGASSVNSKDPNGISIQEWDCPECVD